MGFFFLFDNVVWLYGVTISKKSEATEADVIKFVDNDKTYYAFPENLTTLPVGDGGLYGCDFVCWTDADGVTDSDIPAAGTTLYSKYPLSSVMSEVSNSVTLNFENSNTETKTIGPNASRNVKGLASANSSNSTNARMYARSTDGVDDADNSGAAGGIKWSGSKMDGGIMFAYDDVYVPSSSTIDYTAEYAYKLTPNTMYVMTF